MREKPRSDDIGGAQRPVAGLRRLSESEQRQERNREEHALQDESRRLTDPVVGLCHDLAADVPGADDPDRQAGRSDDRIAADTGRSPYVDGGDGDPHRRDRERSEREPALDPTQRIEEVPGAVRAGS